MLKYTKDEFDQSYNKIKSISDDFDVTSRDFGQVQPGNWTDAEQLSQFSGPLTKASDEVHASLISMSTNLQTVIANLRSAVETIEDADESVKQDFVRKLDNLTEKVKYTDEEQEGKPTGGGPVLPSGQEMNPRPVPLDQEADS